MSYGLDLVREAQIGVMCIRLLLLHDYSMILSLSESAGSLFYSFHNGHTEHYGEKLVLSAFFSIFLFSKRRIYVQALTIIEYLIANGSERAVDDILDHYSKISVCLILCFYYTLICLILNAIKHSLLYVVSLRFFQASSMWSLMEKM